MSSRKESIYVRSPHTAWQLSGEGGMILHLRAHELTATNPTGALIWEALATPQTATQLAARLATEFDVSAEDALAAVQAFLAELEAKGLLEQAPGA